MSGIGFESAVNRALVVGGLVCFLPFCIFFLVYGTTSLHRWHIYAAAIILMVCLGIVNKSRELVAKSINSSVKQNNSMILMKAVSVLASFLIGSILSLGFSLTFLLALKGA